MPGGDRHEKGRRDVSAGVDRQPAGELTALDWIAVVLSGLLALSLVTLPLAVAPAFAAMFRDFGGPLPAVTRLVLQPWLAPALSLAPVGLLAAALSRPHASLRERRVLIVAAFVLGLGAGAFCLCSLYAPIFALAGAIKP